MIKLDRFDPAISPAGFWAWRKFSLVTGTEKHLLSKLYSFISCSSPDTCRRYWIGATRARMFQYPTLILFDDIFGWFCCDNPQLKSTSFNVVRSDRTSVAFWSSDVGTASVRFAVFTAAKHWIVLVALADGGANSRH